jgi:hypothetical protein
MKQYIQEAENLRLTLIAGIVNMQDIVQWADSTLIELDHYNDDLANISLASKSLPQEVDSILKQLGQGADKHEAIRNLLGLMHGILRKDRTRASDFIGVLDRLWIESDCNVPKDLGFMTVIDDEFYLAEQGICPTVDQVIDNLIVDIAEFDKDSKLESPM